MYFEKYGDEQAPIIVFLHGAHFVHAFGRQYTLADKYRLVVPHIVGFGNEADRVFNAKQAVTELAEFIKGFDKKVTLIGFSLGAQIAVKLIAQHPELFNGAIVVSPWLIKQEPMLSEIYKGNEKQFRSLQNKWLCSFTGLMNGLPAAQRKEFVAQMQRVQLQTVKNTVYNGIALDTINGFENAAFPIIALAGEKEQDVMRESVLELSRRNPNCSAEVWERAAHNIPPVFYHRFNALICGFMMGSHF